MNTKKIFTTIIFILMAIMLVSNVLATPLVKTYFDSDTSSKEKTIELGDSTIYKGKVSYDWGLVSSKIYVDVYDHTRDEYTQAIFYDTFTPVSNNDLSYYTGALTLLPEHYNNLPGQYTIYFVAEQTVSINGVTDVTSNFDSLELTVTGNIEPENNAPTIAHIPNQVIDEGTYFSYALDVSDADNDDLICSISTNHDWLSVDDCVISGTAPLVDADVTKSVTVTVTDLKDDASTVFELTVKDIPVVNNAPTIAHIPNQVIDEGTYFSYALDVSDADNDDLICSISTNHDWLSVDDCVISGTAPLVDADVTKSVTVTVTDLKDDASTVFELTVKDIPIIPENKAPIADFTFLPNFPIVGQTVTFTDNSYDTDGQVVKWEWNFNNDANFDKEGKVVTYEFTSQGTFIVTLRVTDNNGAIATKTKNVSVKKPIVYLDALTCNANVVQRHEQHCIGHVSDSLDKNIAKDMADAFITFKYVNNNEVLGTCKTTELENGSCHINPIINKAPGDYEVYATVTKVGYEPDNSMKLRTTFKVWLERYDVKDLATFEDVFVTENYTFYRGTSVYAAFNVVDMFTGQNVPPTADLVKDVFLRVNNIDPLNFDEYVPVGQPLTLSKISNQEYQSAVLKRQGKVTNVHEINTVVGDYKYVLEKIPLTDDFQGYGKVFAFVFNFTNHTAGQDTVNVNILNNEATFEAPDEIPLVVNVAKTIDFKQWVSDVETLPIDFKFTHSDPSGLVIQHKGDNVYDVFALEELAGKRIPVIFKADDTDGSITEQTITFVIGNVKPTNQKPQAIIYISNKNPEVDESITIRSDSTDDKAVVTQEWLIQGEANSIFDEEFTYSFDTPGNYSVSLIVQDEEGLTDWAQEYVLVVEAKDNNTAPTVDFTYSPLNPVTGENVTFIANAFDINGDDLYYTWRIDGIVVSNEESFKHIFTQAGTYNVSLTVYDGDVFVTVWKLITIGDSNLGAPIAIISPLQSPYANKLVVFDGSKSYDPDGEALTNYAWKISKNGVVMHTQSELNTHLIYSFPEKGRYLIELTVKDVEDKTGSTSIILDVGRERNQRLGYGDDDGLFIDQFEVYGLERGVIGPDEPYTITATVTNDRNSKLENVALTFSIPELGYKIEGQKFDLKAGETRNLVIQDYLPFLPQEIDPGEYYALVTAHGDNIIRTKYYPLIIK